MTPRVSVVMPFLNSSPYLAEAIESVTAQSFSDWELILVDDGSTDGSASIASAVADGSAGRIVVLPPDPERRGAAAARNRGIAASTGALVAFLDADDFYLQDKLAHDVAALDADPHAAWVYGATRWFHQDGSRRDRIDRLGVRLDRRYDPPRLLIRVIIGERGDVPCTCAVMIRRGALEAVGGFEERFRTYEDQTLWAKLLLSYPVRVVSGCHAVYRQHGASTSALAAASGDYDQKGPHAGRRAFLEWLVDYAAGHDAAPRVVAAARAGIARNEGGLMNHLRRRIRRLSRFIP